MMQPQKFVLLYTLAFLTINYGYTQSRIGTPSSSGIQELQSAIGGKEGATDTALLQFLNQQKWATAYEKNQGGQNTLVIQNTQGSPALTIPPPAAANGAKGEE